MKEVTTNDGKKGGWLKGKPHYDKNGKSLGGIKAIVTDTGRQVELEGGEVIINKEASAKHWKELSRINQSAGGGVAISPPNGANDEDPEEYSKGGKIEFNANHIPNKWILKYAENIKKNHPEIWKLGGNIFGNEAFVNLQRVAKRGHWIDSEEWMYIKWRSYVARHKGDFRIEGVVAMLKWVDKVDKGWDYMKNLIQEKINKLSEPKSMRIGGDVNDKNANIKFMQWYVGWYKKISDKINITFSLPNILSPFKEKNVIILDLFEKIEQDIDAKPYLKEILKKADEHGVTIYLEPMPKYKYFLKNIDKRKKISKDYLISYYKKFGFELTSNKNFMKRLPKSNTNEIGWKHKMKEGGALTYKAKYNKKYSYDEDESHDLSDIAKDTKISKKGLQQIYNKGVGAYKTNPESVRGNVKSKEQWGMGRVYSAVMGGKAARVDSNELKMATGGGIEFIPEKKGTLIRGNEIIKYFEKVNGNYRLLFYTLNESKGKVPTICDAFGYCEKLDIHDVTPEQLVELIKNNNLMETGGELYHLGGEIENIESRFELKNAIDIESLNNNIEEIVKGYANRKMVVVQIEKYLNEKKPLGLEWIKSKNIKTRLELKNYLGNLQNKLRVGIKKGISESAKEAKKEMFLEAIENMAIMAEKEYEGKYKYGGNTDYEEIYQVYVIENKEPLKVFETYNLQEAKSQLEKQHKMGKKSPHIQYSFAKGGELKKGIKTEQEHRKTLEKIASGELTVDEAIVRTAKDHLKEDPKYYTKLYEMEHKMAKAGALLDKMPKMAEGGKIEPIRELGNGAKVYYESNKTRVNDNLKDNKIYVIFEFKDSVVPILFKFDTVEEAVYVAKEVDKIYPQGIPEAALTDKIVADIQKKFIGVDKNISRREILDNLHELDLWVKFSDGRWYRKFTIPNDNRVREFTDNGIKERLEEKNGKVSVILSVQSGAEAERVSEIYMETYPVEGMILNPKSEVNKSIVSTNIAEYKNPYEINRAIEKLIDEKGSEHENYTPEEVAFISNYSGYGGLEKQGKFSDEELKGLLYEYYTPDEIVKKMWGLAYKYGYGTIGDNSVFEPSVGIGAFIKYAPNNVLVGGNEINRYSARICHILYPEAQITLMPFEQNFIAKNLSVKNKVDKLPYLQNRKFSLVIGNPPYGKLGGKYMGMGEDKYSMANNYTEYFITRGLDIVVKGGLLIYVVGAEQYNGGTLFLDSALSNCKKAIFDKADLIDAYRLPANIFERTGVSTEILIFRKR